MRLKDTTYYFTCFLFFPLFSFSQIIGTIAGNGIKGYSGNGGLALSAELNNPQAVAMDNSGNLYIADSPNNVVRKVSISGVITLIAGNGTAHYSGDNGLATKASLNMPSSICFDISGNLYIADYLNNVVRKVNTSGIISTIAGTGMLGFSGDNATATSAELNMPSGVCADKHGNIYISDESNNRVRMVNNSGIITTVAGDGNQSYLGDGKNADSAEMSHPKGVFIDNYGNLYIADFLNNAIRMVNTLGIINTIAGYGIAGYSGDNGPATSALLNYPTGVCADTLENVYIADSYNNVIREIDNAGNITTIAGIAEPGYYGDGGPAVLAELNNPQQICLDKTGINLYIPDELNNRIRFIKGINGIPQAAVDIQQFTIYPVPASNYLWIRFPLPVTEVTSIKITDVTGKIILQKNIFSGDKDKVNISNLSSGIYLLFFDTKINSLCNKFIKE